MMNMKPYGMINRSRTEEENYDSQAYSEHQLAVAVIK